MDSVRNLLFVVSGLGVINVTVAGLVWRQSRTPYHRSLFFVWFFGILSLVAQGIVQSERWMITAFGVSVFLINLMLADLIRRVLDLRVPWRTHLWLFAIAFFVSQAASVASLPFWARALPMSLGAALPLLDLLGRSWKRSWRHTSATVRCTLFAAACFAIHNIDYAFFRLDPRFAAVGFVPAILAVFALSITTPAIILERMANDNAELHRTAQRAIASRDEFLMVASHELRTPLASLRLTVQGLRSGALPIASEKLAPLLRLAERQTDKMARLVEAMLSFSFIPSHPGGEGAGELNRTPTDLVAVVQKVTDSFREELRQTGSTVQLVGPPRAMGDWDRPKLEQALMHLLSNAIKFGEGKDIEVSVEQGTARTTCCVRDHGIGIPADRLPYVFDRFERAVSARQYGGLGLGLFIVRSIVEAHDGNVRVSSSVGAGTRICVELPHGGVAS